MCPPGLHISLGIFFRLFTLLEESCHELDLLLAQHSNSHLRTGSTFEEYSTALRNRHQLREQSAMYLERVEQLEQFANFVALTASQVDTSELLDHTRTAVTTYRKKQQEAVSTQLFNTTRYSMITISILGEAAGGTGGKDQQGI